MNQADKYHEAYPYHSRDVGAEILNLVANSKDEEIVLVDSTSFAGNGVFCEWAYVIDLDKNQLEVYTGFNTEPLAEDERFANLTSENSGGYTGVRCIKKYDLDLLPTKRKFVSELKKIEKEVYHE